MFTSPWQVWHTWLTPFSFSFAMDNLLLSCTLPVLPISSIGCSLVHVRATPDVADDPASTLLRTSSQLCQGQSATLMHSAGASDIFNRLLLCACPCNFRCSRCLRFYSSSRIGCPSLTGLWPSGGLFDVCQTAPCILACLRHVWPAQHRNQSALPDSAPPEHSDRTRAGRHRHIACLHASWPQPFSFHGPFPLSVRGSATVVQRLLFVQVVWHDVTCMLHCWGCVFSCWWRWCMYAEVTICAAVDRMRHWNCFGLSVHIVLDLLRTVGQCLFTCCHVWTCFCCSLITYRLVVFGLRPQAGLFTHVYFRHTYLISHLEANAYENINGRKKARKVVTVAVPRNYFGDLLALEATCWLCLEVFNCSAEQFLGSFSARSSLLIVLGGFQKFKVLSVWLSYFKAINVGK